MIQNERREKGAWGMKERGRKKNGKREYRKSKGVCLIVRWIHKILADGLSLSRPPKTIFKSYGFQSSSYISWGSIQVFQSSPRFDLVGLMLMPELGWRARLLKQCYLFLSHDDGMGCCTSLYRCSDGYHDYHHVRNGGEYNTVWYVMVWKGMWRYL